MIAAIFVAAAAAVTVLILLLRYKRLKCRKCCRTLLIIPVTADDDLFERRVKACYWEESFGNPLYAKEILLVIMQPSANAYTARRLAQEYRSVHAVYLSSLNDYLIRNYVNYECKKTDS
jgi:hypothetical protein